MPIFSWLGGNSADKPADKHHKFAIKMSCNGCCNAIKKAVEGKGGVHKVECDLEKQQVDISGWLTKEEAEEYLRATGKDFSFVE